MAKREVLLKLPFFTLSLLLIFLYSQGFDPLAPPYTPFYSQDVKYMCTNFTIPHVSLADQNGSRVEFPPPGPYVVTFGYTTCPDVCPLVFLVLNKTQYLTGLPAYVVTVDPAGDTPERLRAYAAATGYRFVFLTGEQVEVLWRSFGVYVGRARYSGGYLIYHSVVFAFGEGDVVKAVAYGLADPDTLASLYRSCWAR
ncbi:SCO family protein [Pyrobaculum ferrireducens]|uniref:Sco1-like protein n=1 Tax=Pyrobaculum ferrireducens TaxID=1104324 RepID=G7VAH6_9CREN|nr:SCO family protein [Pyrobaculum ferrireducens]AET32215.1 Sco1-like protein [Pyrobaculum ferrireducens]